MTILRPVPGWAPGVRALADSVQETGHRLAAACADLVRIRDGAVWDGPAGEGFSARVQGIPTPLDRAARRHLCAVGPLRSWADALEEEQWVAGRAITEHDDAVDAYAVLEDRVYALRCAGRDEADPEVAVLRELQREQAGTITRTEAQHAAALDRLEAEGTHCAAVLRGLADDDIADSVVYRGLRVASSTGHGVGLLAAGAGRLVPYGTAAAIVGEGVGTLSDGALLVGYDEGSWRDVGVGAAVTATAGLGGSLRAGAKAGHFVRSDGSVGRLFALTAQERLVVGASQRALDRIERTRAAFRPPSAAAVRRAPAPVAPSGSAVHRVLGAGTRAVRTAHGRARTELALVDAGGSTSRRMYAAGLTLTGTSKAAPHLVPDERPPGERPPGERGPTR